MKRIKEIKRLIINVLIVAFIGGLGYFVYSVFFKKTSKQELIIDDTPLRVEQIKAILELNTIQFKDEVVVDTVELYQSTTDRILGSLSKLKSFNQAKNTFQGTKRQLTLIVKGELLYGINLKIKNFEIRNENDSLLILIPEPELLSISSSPKNTEVYIENGEWTDNEKRILEQKARAKMVKTGENLRLVEKSKEPIIKLLTQLVKTEKKLVFRFLKPKSTNRF